MAIPEEIKELGIEDTHIHALVVAAPGWGKTVFAGTAKHALFLTTDPEGTVSALAQGSDAKEWRIHSWTELNKAYAWLRDGGIEEMGLQFVLIDNVSETQNLGMFETMELARKRNTNLDEFVPSQQDYQRSQLMMKAMVKKFHDLPVHIIWTSWESHEEDSNGNGYIAAAIHGQQGALAQTIMGYMNVIGMGEVIPSDDADEDDQDEGVRRIHFSNYGPYRGKDRFHVLGRYRDALDVPKMQSLIEAAMRKYRAKAVPARKAVPVKRPATTAVRSTQRPQATTKIPVRRVSTRKK